MPQNIFVFEKEDVIIAVPDTFKGFPIFVERKDLTVISDPFKRHVINFGVHYIDADGRETAIPKFKPFMQIWVGYKAGEEGYDLNYWDDVNDKKRPMADKKDKFQHKNIDSLDFEGYGYAEMKVWGIDPNVGWD